MRCDGAAAGRQCPRDATHEAHVGATAGPVLGCPEHVARNPELPWQPLADEPPVLKLARVAAAALTQALANEPYPWDEDEEPGSIPGRNEIDAGYVDDIGPEPPCEVCDGPCCCMVDFAGEGRADASVTDYDGPGWPF
jgi:hypothetical protein